MLVFKQISMMSPILDSDVRQLERCVLEALTVYESNAENMCKQNSCRDVVTRFCELRTKGLHVSLVFFLAKPFIEACRDGNVSKEAAVCQLLEDASWVYNKKVLIVLRDLAVSQNLLPQGPVSAIETSYYQSLKAAFGEFLAENGEPSFFIRGLSSTEAVLRLLGLGEPTMTQRLSMDVSRSRANSTEMTDSPLFTFVESYLNVLVSDLSDHAKYKACGLIESELANKTIYSEKLLHIVANQDPGRGITLAQFLDSEYVSLRPKIVQAILKSDYLACLPTVFCAKSLSLDPVEDHRLKDETLLKIAKADNRLWGQLSSLILDSRNTSAISFLFRTNGDLYDAVKITLLKSLSSNGVSKISCLADVHTEVVDFLQTLVSSSRFQEIQALSPPFLAFFLPELLHVFGVQNCVVQLKNGYDTSMSKAFGGPLRGLFLHTLIGQLFKNEFPSEQLVADIFLYKADGDPLLLNRFFNLKHLPDVAQEMVFSLIFNRRSMSLNLMISVGLLRSVLSQPLVYNLSDWAQRPVVSLSRRAYDALSSKGQALAYIAEYKDFKDRWRFELMSLGYHNVLPQGSLENRDKILGLLEKIEDFFPETLANNGIRFKHPKEIVSGLKSRIAAVSFPPTIDFSDQSVFDLFQAFCQTRSAKYVVVDIFRNNWPVDLPTLRLSNEDFQISLESTYSLVVSSGNLVEALANLHHAVLVDSGQMREASLLAILVTLMVLPQTGVPLHTLREINQKITNDLGIAGSDLPFLRALETAVTTLGYERLSDCHTFIFSRLDILQKEAPVLETSMIMMGILDSNRFAYLQDELVSSDAWEHSRSWFFAALGRLWLLAHTTSDAIALHTWLFSRVEETLLHSKVELERLKVAACIDSLWGSNIPVKDILELRETWAAEYGFMCGVRPMVNRSSFFRCDSELPVVADR
jgi:hypothetical protein